MSLLEQHTDFRAASTIVETMSLPRLPTIAVSVTDHSTGEHSQQSARYRRESMPSARPLARSTSIATPLGLFRSSLTSPIASELPKFNLTAIHPGHLDPISGTTRIGGLPPGLLPTVRTSFLQLFYCIHQTNQFALSHHVSSLTVPCLSLCCREPFREFNGREQDDRHNVNGIVTATWTALVLVTGLLPEASQGYYRVGRAREPPTAGSSWALLTCKCATTTALLGPSRNNRRHSYGKHTHFFTTMARQCP